MKKCFEGINTVEFKSPAKNSGLPEHEEHITKIKSKEGEVVELVNKVYPFEYDGKVEMWLS